MRSGKCEGLIHFTQVLSTDPKVMILVKVGGKGAQGYDPWRYPANGGPRPSEVPRGWTLGDTLGSYPGVCAYKNV